MKTNNDRLATRFAPETQFEVIPAPAVPLRATREAEFERLKEKLLRNALRETPYPEFDPLLRRAANEAAGLAWLTPFPLLVLPVLLEEKAQVAIQFGLRQEGVHQRSRELLAETV